MCPDMTLTYSVLDIYVTILFPHLTICGDRDLLAMGYLLVLSLVLGTQEIISTFHCSMNG